MTRLLPVLLFVTSATVAAPVPKAVPVADLIRDLSNDDEGKRDRAEAALWAAGERAVPGLKKLTDDKDAAADTKARAKRLLDKLEWGVYPDTPKGVAAAVEAYRDKNETWDAKRITLYRQVARGGSAVANTARVLVDRGKGDERNWKELKRDMWSAYREQVARCRVENGKDVPQVLELVSEFAPNPQLDAASRATVLIEQGRASEAIRRFESQLAGSEPDRGRAVWLLLELFRQTADTDRALGMADRAAEYSRKWDSGRKDWRRILLTDAKRWDDLLPKPPKGDEVSLEYVACLRLAGRTKELDREVERLVSMSDEKKAFDCYNALLVAHRPDEAFRHDGVRRTNPGVLVEFALNRGRIQDALSVCSAAAEQEELKRRQRSAWVSFDIQRSRVLWYLGEPGGELWRPSERDSDERNEDGERVHRILNARKAGDEKELEAALRDRAEQFQGLGEYQSYVNPGDEGPYKTPHRGAAWHEWGEFLADRDRHAEAAEVFHDAWTRYPQVAMFLYLSGRSLAKSGGTKEGKRRMDAAFRIPMGSDGDWVEFLCELMAADAPDAEIELAADNLRRCCWGRPPAPSTCTRSSPLTGGRANMPPPPLFKMASGSRCLTAGGSCSPTTCRPNSIGR